MGESNYTEVLAIKSIGFFSDKQLRAAFMAVTVVTVLFSRASTSLQFDIYDFRKKLFDLINFFWHELPKNHFPNSILRNVEYPSGHGHCLTTLEILVDFDI